MFEHADTDYPMASFWGSLWLLKPARSESLDKVSPKKAGPI